MGAMFQRKTNEIFRGLPNVFDIADDTLTVGYDADSRDHDRTLEQGMVICLWENLKLNKNKCYFSCTKIPFFGEVIAREVVQPDLKTLWKYSPTNKT